MPAPLNQALRLALLGAALEPTAARSWLSSAKEQLRELKSRDPMDAVLWTVLVGSAIFYVSERGKNPKVNSFYDALVYVSTNLSVGYSDIFAHTPVGKLLGTAVMTWGPSLAASVFESPAGGATPSEGNAVDTNSQETARATLERLDTIIALLKERPGVALP